MGQQLQESNWLPAVVDGCIKKSHADGVRPLHLTRLDQSRNHRRRDRLRDRTEMPAIAEVDRHAAAALALPVGRRSHDLSVDHHHCREANESFLLAEVGDQTREPGAGRAVASRSPLIAGTEHPGRQSKQQDRPAANYSDQCKIHVPGAERACIDSTLPEKPAIGLNFGMS